MKLYCDMDGVLVGKPAPNERKARRYDNRPWAKGGRQLWTAIKAHHPTLLSAAPDTISERAASEKRIWVDRELGSDVELIVVTDAQGKADWSEPGALLIDDGEKFQKSWIEAGGAFILHRDTETTLAELTQILESAK